MKLHILRGAVVGIDPWCHASGYPLRQRTSYVIVDLPVSGIDRHRIVCKKWWAGQRNRRRQKGKKKKA
jgi:hypothetical protein